MIDNQKIIEVFKNLGTSDGEGGLENIDDDNYYVCCLKESNGFYLESISIKDIMKYDDSLKEYIFENQLREYFDEDGDSYTHNDKNIYEYIDGIQNALDVPPIIGFDESGPYVIDGFNRLLQHYINKNFEIDMYIDIKVYDLYFKNINDIER